MEFERRRPEAVAGSSSGEEARERKRLIVVLDNASLETAKIGVCVSLYYCLRVCPCLDEYVACRCAGVCVTLCGVVCICSISTSCLLLVPVFELCAVFVVPVFVVCASVCPSLRVPTMRVSVPFRVSP